MSVMATRISWSLLLFVVGSYTAERDRGHKNYLAEGVKKELSWQFVNGQQWICSTFTGGSWIAQKFSLLKGTLLRSGRYVWYL